MLASEAAKNLIQSKLTGMNFPEGWGAEAVVGKCMCGTPVIDLEFTNLDGRKASIRVVHASKVDLLFRDLEQVWEEFVAGELQEVIQNLPKIKPGDAGTFVNAKLVYIPGVGYGLVVDGASMANLDRFIRDFGPADD